MRNTEKKPAEERRDQDLYGGLIRLHILHHASKRPVFGVWFIDELARHGYKLSPGTLYPLLHGLEEKGYLSSTKEREGKRLCPRGKRSANFSASCWKTNDIITVAPTSEMGFENERRFR